MPPVKLAARLLGLRPSRGNSDTRLGLLCDSAKPPADPAPLPMRLRQWLCGKSPAPEGLTAGPAHPARAVSAPATWASTAGSTGAELGACWWGNSVETLDCTEDLRPPQRQQTDDWLSCMGRVHDAWGLAAGGIAWRPRTVLRTCAPHSVSRLMTGCHAGGRCMTLSARAHGRRGD